MEHLDFYRKLLYRASEGDPIKLATILQRDLLHDNPNSFELFEESINADNVIKVAHQIVNNQNKKKSKKSKT